MGWLPKRPYGTIGDIDKNRDTVYLDSCDNGIQLDVVPKSQIYVYTYMVPCPVFPPPHGMWGYDAPVVVYIHMYIQTYLSTYLHTYIPTYLPTYVPTYLRTYLPTYVPTYLRTYVPTYLRTYIHTYIPTYLPTYLHTYIHTHIHTYGLKHHCPDCEIGHSRVKLLLRPLPPIRNSFSAHVRPWYILG